MSKITIVISFVIFFYLPIISYAQHNRNSVDSMLMNQMAMPVINSLQNEFKLDLPEDFLKDTTVYNSIRESLISYYTYKKNEYKQANKVFYWQLISSKIIFVVVLLIVLSGIWFSGVQFYHSMKIGEKLDSSNLEISGKGIKINSSVIGLLILTLSIVFFYMYLVYVYPIEQI